MTTLMNDVETLLNDGTLNGKQVGPTIEESLKMWGLALPKAKGVVYADGVATFSSRQRKYEDKERVIKREIRKGKAESAVELSTTYQGDKTFEIPVSEDTANYEQFIRAFPHLFIDMI